MRFVIIGLILLSFTTRIEGSHLAGGWIEFEYLQGQDYRFNLSFVEYCSNPPLGSTMAIDIRSSCGIEDMYVYQDTTYEISSICTGQIPNSLCNGGTVSGFRLTRYSGVKTLPPCVDWVASLDLCCIGPLVSNSGTLDLYLKTEFNNVDYPTNSSPKLRGRMQPHVIINQDFSLAINGSDPNCDEIVYEKSPLFSSNGNPVTYTAPYSAMNPFGAYPSTLDTITGLWSSNIGMIGGFIASDKTSDLDQSGNVKSAVHRVWLVTSIPAGNAMPGLSQGFLNQVVGAGTQIDSTTMTGCEGASICFEVEINDPDATNPGHFVYADLDGVMDNVTYSFSGTNPLIVEVCGNVAYGCSGTRYMVLTYSDDACDLHQLQDYVLKLIVVDGADTSIAVNGTVLTSMDSTAISYQWLDCSNGLAPITGATNQTFNAALYNSVALAITTANGCTDTTSCVSNVGLDELKKPPILIFPNPSSDIVILELDTNREPVHVEIYNMQGDVVLDLIAKATIEIDGLSPAMYLVKAHTSDGVVLSRLLVE